MSPLLDIQRRMAEVGRIRIGKRDGNRPTKLATFRITSQSRELIESVAGVYGGTVAEWKAGPKEPVQYEVVTDTDALNIVVAPGQTLTAWYELWSGGGCQRRCDGFTEQLTDTPCKCPDDPEERRTAAQKGAACKPTTRFSCMLRDVPVIGLFRLESHGFYAAVELSGVAELLEHATSRGLFIPARLRLDQRTSKKNGQTMRYAVPVVEIAATFTQVSEALGTLPTADGTMPALPAPQPAPVPSDRAALLAAAKGRQPKTSLPNDSPPLPDDPSFTFASSTGPTLEAAPAVEGVTTAAPPPARPQMDTQTKRAQQLHVAARNGGVADMLADLVAHVTGGRSRSAKDVEDNEASAIYDIMFRLKRGKLVAAYDPDGQLRLVEQ